MYDSDEVRDAVRREMLSGALTPGAENLEWPPEETVALRDAVIARQVQAAQQIEQVLDALMQRLTRLATEAFGAMAEALKGLGDAAREIEELFGLMIDIAGPGGTADGVSRRRRGHGKPVIRPLHLIDPVAAGRHPAMIMRTKIRGGRR